MNDAAMADELERIAREMAEESSDIAAMAPRHDMAKWLMTLARRVADVQRSIERTRVIGTSKDENGVLVLHTK